jgi:plastocyanin
MSPSTKLLPTLVASAAVALGAAGTASASDGKTVKAIDACDPSSFNAALGEGACVRDGGGHRTSFDSLVKSMMQKGENGRWKFSKDDVKLDAGETLHVEMGRGGEGHTFTEVPAYGPGCVQLVNDLIGAVGAPATDCALMEPTFIGPQRESFDVTGLSAGTHYFECLVHPWMQTTVTVR